GPRMLVDVVVPGGAARDLALGQIHSMHDEAERIAREVPELRAIYDEHAGLQERSRTPGRLSQHLPTKLAMLGLAGRESDIARDVRCDFPFATSDALNVRMA